MPWNQELFSLMYGVIGTGTLLEDVTIFFAWWFPYLLVLGALVYELYMREEGGIFRAAVRIFSPPAAAYIAAKLIKIATEFPRPFVALAEVDPLVRVGDLLGSFPSGHATFFMALGVTMYFCNRRLGIFYIIAALLIGIARIGAGVHWPLDIAAGFLLGAGVAVVIEVFYRLAFKKHPVIC